MGSETILEEEDGDDGDGKQLNFNFFARFMDVDDENLLLAVHSEVTMDMGCRPFGTSAEAVTREIRANMRQEGNRFIYNDLSISSSSPGGCLLCLSLLSSSSGVVVESSRPSARPINL